VGCRGEEGASSIDFDFLVACAKMFALTTVTGSTSSEFKGLFGATQKTAFLHSFWSETAVSAETAFENRSLCSVAKKCEIKT